MSVAVVAVQTVGNRAIVSRTAVIRRTGGVGAFLVPRDREVEIVGNEKIQIAIAVVIEKRRARAPQRIADPRFLRHIRESAVAVISKQRLRSEARDQQIEIAVVVVIADGGAHAVGAKRHARLGRDVGEMQSWPAIWTSCEIVAEQ